MIKKEAVREEQFNPIVIYGIWIQTAFVKITQISVKLKIRYCTHLKKHKFPYLNKVTRGRLDHSENSNHRTY